MLDRRLGATRQDVGCIECRGGSLAVLLLAKQLDEAYSSTFAPGPLLEEPHAALTTLG